MSTFMPDKGSEQILPGINARLTDWLSAYRAREISGAFMVGAARWKRCAAPIPAEFGNVKSLLHRTEAKQVALGVFTQAYPAKLFDGELGPHDFATGCDDA